MEQSSNVMLARQNRMSSITFLAKAQYKVPASQIAKAWGVYIHQRKRGDAFSCSSMSDGANDVVSNERIEREPAETSTYKVLVTTKFVVASLLASTLLAFSVGRAARLFLLEGPRRAILSNYRQSTLRDRPIGGGSHSQHDPPLPFLVARTGQQIPHTKYSSKTFDTAKSTMSSSWLITNRDAHWLEGDDDTFPHAQQNSAKADDGSLAKRLLKAIADISDEDEKTLPAAEHLMVDIKNVDGTFLNSEHRLALAMIAVVEAANLTLLSYHCHGMEPTGVSCAGILTHNYIAFHTWPDQGVITFDLVAGDGKSILTVLSVIEERFGVPRAPSHHGEAIEGPSMRWAHKLRGFRHHSTKFSDLFQTTDLGGYLLSILGTEFKEEVASIQTDFQRIDVYDVIFQKGETVHSYRKSLSNDGSYESNHKSLFRPERVLFLDGWIQSTRRFEAAYHEALVQPAMFASSNPKRVAIIGGGEGATLREVLKHKTVEKAFMIEIDETMVQESKEYIPEWSDCSDLEGSAPWCVDDPRAEMYYEDALGWFMDRKFGEIDKDNGGLLDVIILDALDPEAEVPFAQALYGNDKFMRKFFDSLSDDGILVMQLGEAPKYRSPDETDSKFRNRATTMKLLERLGFESVHVYEESHCGFRWPWSLLVAFKSYATRERWYANSAEIDKEVQKRGVRTKSGVSPFRYFDGPTMVSYQVPHRSMETVFCRRNPIPKECQIGEYDYDPAVPNVPSSSFEVKYSTVSENAGRGIFTKVDIPNDAYLSAETNVQAVSFMPSTATLIREMAHEHVGSAVKIFDYYMEGYGFYSRQFGENVENTVDSGILTFVNHGCRGSYNMGLPTPFDEFTADIHTIGDEVRGRSHQGTTIFNPVVDRHLRYQADHSLRDIKAGEEILDNYLDFVGKEEFWEESVMELRAQCSGEAVGDVIYYERNRSKRDRGREGEL